MCFSGSKASLFAIFAPSIKDCGNLLEGRVAFLVAGPMTVGGSTSMKVAEGGIFCCARQVFLFRIWGSLFFGLRGYQLKYI